MKKKDAQVWLDIKYPLTIIADRYGGTYSRGRFLAFPLGFNEVPEEVAEDDVPCVHFWGWYNEPVGRGTTPEEAYLNLIVVLTELKEEQK